LLRGKREKKMKKKPQRKGANPKRECVGKVGEKNRENGELSRKRDEE